MTGLFESSCKETATVAVSFFYDKLSDNRKGESVNDYNCNEVWWLNVNDT